MQKRAYLAAYQGLEANKLRGRQAEARALELQNADGDKKNQKQNGALCFDTSLLCVDTLETKSGGHGAVWVLAMCV